VLRQRAPHRARVAGVLGAAPPVPVREVQREVARWEAVVHVVVAHGVQRRARRARGAGGLQSPTHAPGCPAPAAAAWSGMGRPGAATAAVCMAVRLAGVSCTADRLLCFMLHGRRAAARGRAQQRCASLQRGDEGRDFVAGVPAWPARRRLVSLGIPLSLSALHFMSSGSRKLEHALPSLLPWPRAAILATPMKCSL